MFQPSPERYSSLVASPPPGTFASLQDATFQPTVLDGELSYCFFKGSSAAIYKAQKDGQAYAVRFFLKEDPELFRRYEEVETFLASRSFPWKLDIEFLKNELQADGQAFPVLKMEWAEGVQLGQFLEEHKNQPALLSELQRALVALSADLEHAGIGHGDLNYHHVLVEQGRKNGLQLKLVDYDTLFIPAFEGMRNSGAGTSGFQHPKRLATDFSPTIDRFSVWVFLTLLEALKADPSLLPEVIPGSRRKSFFTLKDLVNPAGSRLFGQLRSLGVPALTYYLNQLVLFTRHPELSAVEAPALYTGQRLLSSPELADLRALEIRSIPAGRDVLVNGVKKGVTPLQLNLTLKEVETLAVASLQGIVPVPYREGQYRYELNLREEGSASRPDTASEDILEFAVDALQVRAGDAVTLRWKVKGDAPIVLEPFGSLAERTGKRRVTLEHTTDFVLRVGDQQKTLHVQVSSKRRHPRVNRRKGSVLQELGPKKAGMLLAVAAFLVFGIYYAIQPKDPAAPVYQEMQTNEELAYAGVEEKKPAAGPFSTEATRSFLQGLYAAYNRRDLPAMRSFYAPRVTMYYDSRNLSADSLQAILKDLFIAPAFYQCRPDMKTLRQETQGAQQRITLELTETLQEEKTSRRETYTTRVEYLVDRNYKIVSERKLD
jgi:hypothetical protein